MSPPPPILPVGFNSTLFWGMTVDERLRRIAGKYGLALSRHAPPSGQAILVNRRYVFDPAWLDHVAQQRGHVLTVGNVPVIAHCRTAAEQEEARRAMEGDRPLASGSGLRAISHEGTAINLNPKLRKREQPFAIRLGPDTVGAAERASYYGAYKGVTDILTKYLWPEWALALTRLCAAFRITPNAVTTIGAVFCVLATLLFVKGMFWLGMAAALAFMVLDTVDGKLARCTITSSKFGNIFDHGIDQVHPPFWWYAWGLGLARWGQPLEGDDFALVMGVIIGGYVVQRVIEGTFMRLYGMHIHVWRRIDSQFRLITARRNPNMVILLVFLIFNQPDVGLFMVAWWTVISCVFHGIRLAQAMRVTRSGGQIRGWLS